MNSKLERWLNKNKPARVKSNLHEFRDEILHLSNSTFTLKQICEYLEEVHNVETTFQNVSYFIKQSHKKQNASTNSTTSKEIVKPKKESVIEEKSDELEKYLKRWAK